MNGVDLPIRFHGVTVCFGRFRALDSVTFAAPAGTVTALLGRNGAGKTTAIRALLGLLEPTRGDVYLLGSPAPRLPPSDRGRIGYVGEGHPLPRWMRVADVVAYQAATFPTFDRDLCRSWMARFALPTRRRVLHLSRGMQAQLSLVLALAPRPDLVVMDDPALGLDTVARREFLDAMIDLLHDEGKTILLTGHVLTDVERVADRIVLLDRGVVRVDATLDEVTATVRRYEVEFAGVPPAAAPDLPGLVRARVRLGRWHLTISADEREARTAIESAGGRIVGVERLPLEEIFVDYTTVEATS